MRREIIRSLMIAWPTFRQYLPYELRARVERFIRRAFSFVHPYIQVTFNEFTGERFSRSEAYTAIENYLYTTLSSQAKRLKADVVKNNQNGIVLRIDDHEEVSDDFQGVKFWWKSGKTLSKTQSLYPVTDEKRYYKLTFHKRHRGPIIESYLSHVPNEGKEIKLRNRQQELYTNNGSHRSHVVFEHPASFETLAIDPERKEEIMDDLLAFSEAEEFYAWIGKAWKRGYLLYGPPGTRKSTMIAAMANLLNYDIYDLELTAVKDNTKLRKLLIETSSKFIIVIEDIDCSLDLTGQRRKKEKSTTEGEEEEKAKNDKEVKKVKKERGDSTSQVTLPCLLNFIDGLWSACGGGRIIVFTTNFVDKLDPALVRKGRMDRHIELGYCGFEAFKVLAKGFFGVERHELFEEVKVLLEEVKMTPADVVEHLMPTKVGEKNAVETGLRSLVRGLKQAREEAS